MKVASSSPSVIDPRVRELTQVVINGTVGSEECRNMSQCWWRHPMGYFVPDDIQGLDVDKSAFVSPDNRTAMLIGIRTNHAVKVPPGGLEHVWAGLQTYIDGWVEKHGDAYTVGTTHEQALLKAASAKTVSDFEHGDMVTLPIALVVLLFAVGPSALVVLLTLPATFLAAFMLLYSVSGVLAFADFTPAIFINVLIAVTLDYALFMLSRYREEIVKRGAQETSTLGAVTATLEHAGRVVFVSGATLAIAFVGLALIDVDVVRALGVGGAMILAAAVTANLTLLPAVLYLLGRCCRPMSLWRPCSKLRRGGSGAFFCSCCCRRCCFKSRWAIDLDDDAVDRLAAFLDPADTDHGASTGTAPQPQQATSGKGAPFAPGGRPDVETYRGSRCWVALGRCIELHKIKTVLLVLAVTAPFAYLASQLRVSLDQTQLTPRSAAPMIVMDEIQKRGISRGILSPVEVVTFASNVSNLTGTAAAAGAACITTSPNHGGGSGGGKNGSVAASGGAVASAAGTYCSNDNWPVPGAMDLGCVNDEYDLHRILWRYTDQANELGCDAVKSFGFCYAKHLPIKALRNTSARSYIKRLCPGTCTRYCRNSTAYLQNVSVLTEAFFDRTRLFRETVIRELGLAPDSIRDIAGIAPNATVAARWVHGGRADGAAKHIAGPADEVADSASHAAARYRDRFANLSSFDHRFVSVRQSVSAGAGVASNGLLLSLVPP